MEAHVQDGLHPTNQRGGHPARHVPTGQEIFNLNGDGPYLGFLFNLPFPCYQLDSICMSLVCEEKVFPAINPSCLNS